MSHVGNHHVGEKSSYRSCRPWQEGRSIRKERSRKIADLHSGIKQLLASLYPFLTHPYYTRVVLTPPQAATSKSCAWTCEGPLRV